MGAAMRPIRPGRHLAGSGSPVRPRGSRTIRRRQLYRRYRRHRILRASDLATPSDAMRQSGEWDFPLPMAYEKIRYDVGDGVATIALDDPDTRNSLSNDLLGELIEAFDAARNDDAVRCVVLASTHEKVFSSGGNVAQFAADTPLVHRHFATERFVRLFGIIGGPGEPPIFPAPRRGVPGAPRRAPAGGPSIAPAPA